MAQLQALQLGFKGFKSLAAVATGKLRIGPLVSLRIGASSMGSDRNVSGSSKPVAIVAEDNGRKRNRLKAFMGAKLNQEKPLRKETDVERCPVEVESFEDDPERIEKMTVQELRTTLRSIGVPAKGRKPDLVSALKLFMDKKINGQTSQMAAENKSASVDTEAENLYEEDQVQVHKVTTVSEVRGLKRSKKVVKKSGDEGKADQFNVKPVANKRKLSVKSVEVSGRKRSQKETSISTETIGVRTDYTVKMPMLETEPWMVLAHKKPQKHWVPYNPRTMRPPPLSNDTKSMKLMSWNVNGLRALLKLEGFSALELAQREDFDVLCLQETKLQEKDVKNVACMIDGYHNNFWTCSAAKLGYSGTAIISRIEPLSVRYGLGISDHDSEGRLVTAEFDSFYLICGYVPNSGDGLKRLTYRTTQWDPSLSSYIKDLEKSKPVILTGDLNCAHQEIDIYNPAGNKRSAGFTIEERQSFERNFLSNGFVDTFRRQHPAVVGYTYWGFRHGARKTNKGWRLDYFLASESIADQVHDSYIVPDIHGSDHCPIGLVLKL